MRSIFDKTRKAISRIDYYFTIKKLSIWLIILNLISFVFGILVIIFPIYNFSWDIFGIIIIITLFGNLWMIYKESKIINRSSKSGFLLNLLCYFYPLIFIICTYDIILGNFNIASSYEKAELKFYFYVYFGYFAPLIFAIIIAILNLILLKENNRNLRREDKIRGFLKIRKFFRFILALYCFLFLIVGVHFVLIILFGSIIGLQPPEFYGNKMTGLAYFGGYNGIIGMFVAMFALSWAFVFASITVIISKAITKNKHPKMYKSFTVIGVIITGVCMLPLLSTPYYIYSANNAFSEAFGEDWRDKIPNDIEQKYFLKTPYSIPYYFFSQEPKEVEVKKDILFYNDSNIQLYFDAYLPPKTNEKLPGEHSVLIWIHGGGWTIGDKGNYRIQFNKYFAAQGYVVFDIQYGLYDSGTERYGGALSPPEHVKGDFDIDDMIEHIGIFTKYLVNNSEKYEANLNSVFISGGSAGGHLTCVTALAIASGNYKDIFPSDNLTIKGYIPYYPGNRLPILMGLDGKDEFIEPAKLVEKNSPPSLIFQGTNDGLVNPKIVQDFKDAYDKNDNEKCAVIWVPFAGHASDIYFGGYYNMVFLYYMERFMYLCVNDYI